MSQIVFAVISIVITVAIMLIVKLIDRVKFKELTGSHKIVVVVCILAIAGELVYLSISFGLLTYAFETIATARRRKPKASARKGSRRKTTRRSRRRTTRRRRR